MATVVLWSEGKELTQERFECEKKGREEHGDRGRKEMEGA